jgi:hypothetical protein
MLCDTFYNAVSVQNLNALIGGGSDGFKTCTTATVATDCTYQTTAGVKTAADLGYSCMATSYSATAQYYCLMAGGESVFLTAAKSVIYTII